MVQGRGEAHLPGPDYGDTPILAASSGYTSPCSWKSRETAWHPPCVCHPPLQCGPLGGVISVPNIGNRASLAGVLCLTLCLIFHAYQAGCTVAVPHPRGGRVSVTWQLFRRGGAAVAHQRGAVTVRGKGGWGCRSTCVCDTARQPAVLFVHCRRLRPRLWFSVCLQRVPVLHV